MLPIHFHFLKPVHLSYSLRTHFVKLPSFLPLARKFTETSRSEHTPCNRRELHELMSMINHRRPDNTFSENTDLFDILMEVCASMNAIQEAKQTHVHAIITGFDQYAFLQAKVIAMYDRLGLLIDSRMAFNSIRNPKILSWNAIIRAYVCHGNFNEAMRMYHLMAANGVCGDGFTFPLIIRSCSATGSVEECRKVHDDLVQVGLELRLHVANGLIGMYSRLGRMDIAASIFERMPLRDVISWNILMSGYVSNLDCGRALALFERMVSGKLKPNSITWTSLISAHSRCAHYDQALCLFVKMRTLGALLNGEIVAVVLSVCSRLSALNKGKEIHGYVIRGGFEHLMCVNNSLVDMYGTCGVMDDAKAIFQEMGEKDLVTWNAMISCYALVGYCHKAFELFSQLEIEKKKELRPNVVTWSSVINGFASKGNGEKALELFRQMQMAGIEPNSVTMATMLSVLADLAALDHGKEIHGHLVKGLHCSNPLLGNGLIHLYTKCGSLEYGCMVFNRMTNKDIVSWNSMIAGYGMHGYGIEALCLFDRMFQAGLSPDHLTFVAVLSACSRSGLVKEGHELFDRMTNEFKLKPWLEHYACMVDLLGRAGFLVEARDFVKNMPLEPNPCIWGALLHSCRIHKNVTMAEEIAQHLFELEPDTTGSYMLLSNIYASCGRWEESAKVRILSKTKGLKKEAGQSWIEVKKKVYMFKAGFDSQPGLDEVYAILEDLTQKMGAVGYVPDNTPVVDKEEKEINSLWP